MLGYDNNNNDSSSINSASRTRHIEWLVISYPFDFDYEAALKNAQRHF
jgi:RNase H-fold protein (predicted Holliday junction resolvase)